MKRILIIAAGVLLLFSLIGGLVIFRLVQTVRALDERYSRVERGMTAEQVEEIMNYDGSWFTERDPMAFWDDRRLPESEDGRIRSTLAYSAPSLIMGVTLEFSFDGQRRVVGRHRYD